ncbi:hypothetical protein ABZ078_20015 [Streptomyces sp. NPDC006385]|uniref:hypothetical protein n=1 Tax=Streptomyces sp. NPDC006385 TaxID=3156761 RepID=UPI0033B1297E
MRIRSILTSVTLTAAMLISGTGTAAAAQSHRLSNGRCLISNLVSHIHALAILDVLSPDQGSQPVDPCAVIVDSGSLQ